MPITNDLIKISRQGLRPRDHWRADSSCYKNCTHNQKCNPIVIQFTDAGKSASGWELGKTWGLRMHRTLRASQGALLTIRLTTSPVVTGPASPIGPNLILVPQMPRLTPKPKTVTDSLVPTLSGTQTPVMTENSDPLWTLMTHTYQMLNESRPDLTVSCWLCFNPKLPYYEGIALLGN